ncbi:hypothetical protein STEG23_015687 [Scotinomys teguina]
MSHYLRCPLALLWTSVFQDFCLKQLEEIHRGLLRLQKLMPEGRAFMHKGFMKANEQIRDATLGGNTIIIALTAGPLMMHTFKETLEEANKSRRMGATVYTVGVHEYNKKQMIDIADSPSNSFGVDKGFSAMQDIIDPLVYRPCTQLVSMQPSTICIKDSYKVEISGHGFGNLKSLSQVLCRFTFSDSRIVDKAPIGTNGNTISCPGPMLLHPGEKVSLGISLNNGLSFIGNKLILTGTSCENTGGEMHPSRDTARDWLKQSRSKDDTGILGQGKPGHMQQLLSTMLPPDAIDVVSSYGPGLDTIDSMLIMISFDSEEHQQGQLNPDVF